MTWKKLVTYGPIACIVALSIFLRFIYLDRIPNAIGGDELTYVLTAKSVYLTGRDITGTWSPWSAFLFRYPPNQQQAELPYFLHLLFSGPFQFSLFTAELPFALLSVGIVLLVYAITQKIIDRNTAIIAGMITAINPWLIYMGRTAYESTPATFFYLLGFHLLLTLHKYKLLLSIPVFFLAFYSYIGMKIIFLPLVLLFCAFARIYNKKDNKIYTAIVAVCACIIVFYVSVIISNRGQSRLSDLFLPSNSIISQTVDAIRKNTINNPITLIAVNKFTIYTQFIITKFYRMLSPVYLFLEGDQFYALYRHGFFYMIDFLFLIIGFFALYIHKRIVWYFLVLVLTLSLFPHLIHSTLGDFSGHISFIFPVGSIIIAFGIKQIIVHFRKATYIFIIASFYILSLLNFLLNYFFQYPLHGHSNFEMRILSRYAELNKKLTDPMVIYSDKNRDFLQKYVFYSNSISRNTIPQIKQANTSRFEFNRLIFNSCDAASLGDQKDKTVVYDEYCSSNPAISHISIVRLSDAGINYRIINDQICQKYELKLYPAGITLRHFEIEKLTEKEFCETFITR